MLRILKYNLKIENIRTKQGLPAAALALTLALTACTGNSHNNPSPSTPSSTPPTPTPEFKITPATVTLKVGQAQQFTASSSLGGVPVWSLIPATGASLSATGLFTATPDPGTYTVWATWNGDPASRASATVTVLPAPTPVAGSTEGAIAPGAQATDLSGQVHVSVVVGSTLQPVTTTDASGSVQVQHGFALFHP